MVIDELTLEILLDEPSGVLPYWLTMPMAGIVPAAYARVVGDEEFERSPVGTGPYGVTSYEPGRSIVLDRYGGHWRSGAGSSTRSSGRSGSTTSSRWRGSRAASRT